MREKSREKYFYSGQYAGLLTRLHIAGSSKKEFHRTLLTTSFSTR